jgi:ubiquinone/menaquinone biosynthesis C-methylase UbiE
VSEGETVQSSSWSEWLAAQEARMGSQLRQTRDFVLANAGIRPGDTVLDLGAGRGLIALAAAERVGPEGWVIASDLDAGCLDALQEVAAATTAGERIRLLQADAAAIPLSDATIDVVTTRSVLEFVPDRAAAVKEAYRVLRPGGRLSCFETVNSYLTPHQQLIDLRPLGELGAQIGRMFEEIYADPSEPMLTFDERDLVRLFEQAGFVEVGLNFLLRWRRYQLTAEQAQERLHERGAASRPTIVELITARLGTEAAQRYADYFVATAPQRSMAVRSGSAFTWGRKPVE